MCLVGRTYVPILPLTNRDTVVVRQEKGQIEKVGAEGTSESESKPESEKHHGKTYTEKGTNPSSNPNSIMQSVQNGKLALALVYWKLFVQFLALCIILYMFFK